MAIVPIQEFGAVSTVSTTTTVMVTVPQAIPSGRFLVVKTQVNQNFSVTVSDTRGNAYTQDAGAVGSNNSAYIHSCQVATTIQAGDEITATFSATTSRKLLSVQELSGIQDSSALDRTGTALGSGLATAVDVPLSAATQQASELVVGVAAGNLGSNLTADFTTDSPWIENTEQEILTGSAGRGLYPAYQIVSATGTYNFGGDLSASGGPWAAAIASYRAAPGVTSLSVPLAAFVDATNNFAYGVFLRDANAAVDPGSGLAELTDTGLTGPDLRLFVEQRVGEDLTIDASDTGADEASSWLGIAAEFRAATAESIKTVTPAQINATFAVTGAVFKAVDQAIAPSYASGPGATPFHFYADESIQCRMVVTATVHKTSAGQVVSIVPSPLGIQARFIVSAEVTGNRAIIPAQINATFAVTAVLTGPAPEIDFVPETKTAPALRPGDTTFPGPDVFPGSFSFRHMREE